MKKTILMTIMSFSTFVGMTQSKGIPSEIKAKFVVAYPKATEVKYMKEGKKFEVEFTNEGKKMSADLDAKGNITETEITIKSSDLPKVVQEYLTKNLKGKKIKEAAEITNAKGMKKFEAEVGGKDYIFDEKGNLLKN